MESKSDDADNADWDDMATNSQGIEPQQDCFQENRGGGGGGG